MTDSNNMADEEAWIETKAQDIADRAGLEGPGAADITKLIKAMGYTTAAHVRVQKAATKLYRLAIRHWEGQEEQRVVQAYTAADAVTQVQLELDSNVPLKDGRQFYPGPKVVGVAPEANGNDGNS